MEHKLVQRDIDSLIFAEYNPRQLTKEQYKHLKDSIDRFGLVDPILVNKNKDRKNIIIGGHQRVKVAKDMNIKEVPVLELDLTYERERELNVRLNRNTGEWDMDSLANFFEVDELVDWGFDEDELILPEEEVIAGLTEDDDVPEVEESICKEGDLWILGEHRLLCGDATKKEDVDKLMDGDKAELMITDPPYGVEYDANFRNEAFKDGSNRAVGKVNNDNNADWSKAWELSSSIVAYVYHAGICSAIVQESLEKCNYIIKSQIIWAKNNFAISRGHYHWKHEPVWYAVKKNNKANWIGDRSQTTVWEIDKPRKNETGHSTQKPVMCMQKPILNHSGDVYDPFLGSGSTLIACEKTNRKCYGMELDPHYCDVIIKRWEDYTGKVAKLHG